MYHYATNASGNGVVEVICSLAISNALRMLSFTFASAPTSKNSALVASACLGRSELTQKAQALEAAEEINIEKANLLEKWAN